MVPTGTGEKQGIFAFSTSSQEMALGFVLSLTANYLLMPIRDAQLLFLGKNHASKLLVATSIVAIPFSSLTTYLVKATVEKTAESILWFYRAYAITALFAYLLLPFTPSDIPNYFMMQCAVVVVFFVIFELFKLLAISLLWSLSTDAFNKDNLGRLLSLFGLSCTAGQTMGSLISWYLLDYGIAVQNLLLFGALSLELCGYFVRKVGMHAEAKTVTESSNKHNSQSQTRKQNKIFSQRLKTIYDDDYLRLIVVYTLCYTITMNLIYVDRLSIVQEAEFSVQEAASFSASVNLASAVITITLQIILSTGSLVKYFGVAFGLYALPIIT
mmetsp:Transcript_7673/g.10061  ORF Transcript_7673/g.10061 Transcript_7673/m.10061 type:complete len:327 (-) Transcript_7673:1378-2358(-)